MIEPFDSKGYVVESVEAGVWKWTGFRGATGFRKLLQTITFDVEAGKVNYVGHVGTRLAEGKLVGFGVSDRFSSLEKEIRAGFVDVEIVNNAPK